MSGLTEGDGPGPGRVTIAIDGPAGSGKSTLSRALADRLGLDRLDTGAMYRSVAWAVLRAGIDPTDRGAVTGVARSLDLEVGERVLADGTDVTDAIRGPEVSAAVSAVAANPAVRSVMVDRQRAWVAERGEGWWRAGTSARWCCPTPTSSST